LPVREVEQLVTEAGDDEYITAYEDEMRRLEGGSTKSYSYGDRPITSLTAQALAEIQRGK
jgi:hypothetical protein